MYECESGTSLRWKWGTLKMENGKWRTEWEWYWCKKAVAGLRVTLCGSWCGLGFAVCGLRFASLRVNYELCTLAMQLGWSSYQTLLGSLVAFL